MNASTMRCGRSKIATGSTTSGHGMTGAGDSFTENSLPCAACSGVSEIFFTPERGEQRSKCRTFVRLVTRRMFGHVCPRPPLVVDFGRLLQGRGSVLHL